MIPSSVIVSDDKNQLAMDAAARVTQLARDAVSERGRFRVALSGGSTPRALYQLLADPTNTYRPQMPWMTTDFFWTDERHVPPQDADSNFRMVNEAMLASVNAPAENIHRVHAEEEQAEIAAEQYETTLREVFGSDSVQVPVFDLILLGIGTEGHTASLFPGSPLLHEKKKWVGAAWVEKLSTDRISMTLPLLNNGRSVIFLVSGPEKANILRVVLTGDKTPEIYPAQAIEPTHGELLWLVDRDAAAEL
jgi:6-phosphogluconolactonase